MTDAKYFDAEQERRVELIDGRLVELGPVTFSHQDIASFLSEWFRRVLGRGHALTGPYPLRIPGGNLRLPEVLATPDRSQFETNAATGAAFVAEVVGATPEDRERDYVTKRSEYAAAGIPEYRIVDPFDRVVLQLVLDGDAYREAGRFAAGGVVRSEAVPGFEVSVDELFETVPR